MSLHTEIVLRQVALERERQDAKWGEQNHPDGTGSFDGNGRISDTVREVREQKAKDAKAACDLAFSDGRGTWRHILREEVEEAFAEGEPEKLRAELVQVAAVAVSWIEAIDRRASSPPSSPAPGGES